MQAQNASAKCKRKMQAQNASAKCKRKMLIKLTAGGNHNQLKNATET